MRILCTSDWHLDASTAGLPREHDLEGALLWVADLAVELQVDLVLFMGDLSDPDPNRAPRAAAMAIDFAVKLSKQGIASRWLVGNHDVIDDGSCTSTLQPLAALGDPLVKLWSTPQVETIDGVSFLVLPYTPRAQHYDATDVLQRMVRQVEGFPVVCGHLTVPAAAMGGESVELAKGRSMLFPQLPAGFRALCLNGHYHRLQQVGSDLVTIPGSLERLTFSETDNEPGVLFFDLKGSRLKFLREPVAGCDPLQMLPGLKAKGWAIRRPEQHVRRLLDVRPDSPQWESGVVTPDMMQAIVRLHPPAGATDDVIARLHQGVSEVAATVKLLPAPKARHVPAQVAQGATAQPTARGVIESVLADWHDRPIGGEAIDDVMVRALTMAICEEAGL